MSDAIAKAPPNDLDLVFHSQKFEILIYWKQLVKN